MSFRKIFNIIVIAVFFVVLAIFIAQNNQAVSIRFMKWSYDSQSGLIVLFSFLAGGFAALLICLLSSLFRKKPKPKEAPEGRETDVRMDTQTGEEQVKYRPQEHKPENQPEDEI